MDWLPYQSNDTIALVNNTKDAVLIFMINDLVIDHTTHYMTNQDCGECDDQIRINNNEINTDFQINIALNENKIVTQQFIVKGITFTDQNPNYTELTDYHFGGHTFDSMRIFQTRANGGSFHTLIIAKGFGIIGFIESGGDTWILADINAEQLIETVHVNNISCN